MAAQGNNSGAQWTAIIVAVIGLISTIGGAWITTRGTSGPSVTAAAAVGQSQTSAGASSAPPAIPAAPQTAPAASSAPVVAPASPAAAPIVIEQAVPLPDSTTTTYNQPWPNSAGQTMLQLERIEAAPGIVRVHLRFDNRAGQSIRWYTATSSEPASQTLTAAIHAKKAHYGVTRVGGALFADPRMVEIPAGAQLSGWLDFTIDESKPGAVTLELTSYTESSAGGRSVEYEPIKLKLDR